MRGGYDAHNFGAWHRTMDLDLLLKVLQSLFYAGGLVIAGLTYRRAKSTILNTVNTEYHKKVIERLAELSEVLYREFDAFSDDAWYKQDDVGYVVECLHSNIKGHRELIVAAGELLEGVAVSPVQNRLQNLTNRYKSDPFLPDQIRDKVVGLLEKRVNVMDGAYWDVMQDYMSALAMGRHWDTLETNSSWLHNRVNEKLNEGGVGIAQVENAVHDIRLEIQRYFKQFNPIA